jgi:hypothetical protein
MWFFAFFFKESGLGVVREESADVNEERDIDRTLQRV